MDDEFRTTLLGLLIWNGINTILVLTLWIRVRMLKKGVNVSFDCVARDIGSLDKRTKRA